MLMKKSTAVQCKQTEVHAGQLLGSAILFDPWFTQ